MLSQAAAFLASVVPWPAPGDPPPWFVNVHWTIDITEGGKAKQIFPGRACTTLEQALNQIEYRLTHAGGTNLFVCMSAQPQGKEKLDRRGRKYWNAIRSRLTALWLKSIWIDIDVKDKGYKTTLEAAEAFNRWRLAAGLPEPSFVVMTGGGGFHVHWALAEAIPVDRWFALASRLVAAIQQHGLLADTAVTIDAARVLRLPQTFNYKYTPPKPAFLQAARAEYRPEYLEDLLKGYQPVAIARPAAVVQSTMGPLFERRPALPYSALGDGIERATFDIDQVAEVCPLVKDAVTHGGNWHPNPLWHAMAALSVHVLEGRNVFHDLANGHPDYDRATSDELYDRVEGDHQRLNTGWTTCAHLDRAGGSPHCANCAHRLEGRSPLNFVNRYLPPPAIPVSPLAQPARGVADYSRNWLPAGYRYDAEQCVVRDVPSDKEGEPDKVLLVFEHPLLDPWPQEGEQVGDGRDGINFVSVFGTRRRNMQVLAIDMSTSDQLGRVLAKQGLPVSNKAEALRLFMAFITDLRKRKENAVKVARMGWDFEDGAASAFTFGGTRFNCKGDLPAILSDPVMQQHYTPVGSPDPWIQAAKLMIGINSSLDLLVAGAFASPLVAFTGHSGITLSCWSSQSGVGKTSAMTVGQCVFGHPASMMRMGDTHNSITARLGILNNCAGYFDEALGNTQTDKQWLGTLHSVTQGRDRSRLGRNSKMLDTQTFSLMMIGAANGSLISHVNDLNKKTPAAMMRLIECEVPPLIGSSSILMREINSLMAKLQNNYGHAGMRYAQYLGQNATAVETMVNRMEDRVAQKFNIQPAERFWSAGIAVLLVGAMLANDLGLTKFNVEGMRDYLRQVLDKMRVIKSTNTMEFTDPNALALLIKNYLGSHRSTVIETMDIPVMVSAGRPHGTPEVPLNFTNLAQTRDRWAARYAHNPHTLWIDRYGLLRWLEKEGFSPTHAVDCIKRFLFAKILDSVTITRGTNLRGTQAVLLEVNCNQPALQGLFN